MMKSTMMRRVLNLCKLMMNLKSRQLSQRLRGVTVQRRKVYDEETERIRRESQAGAPRELPKVSLWKCFLRKLNLSDDLDLLSSVMVGNILVVERTLRRLDREGAGPGAYDCRVEGMTLLSFVIKACREDIATALIANENINIQAQDFDTGLTPLHHSIYLGLEKLVHMIINSKHGGRSTINQYDSKGLTPLSLACALGRYTICCDLFKMHANPEICDFRGWNSLFFAAYGGNRSIVKLILDCGLEKGSKDETGLLAVDIATQLKHGEAISPLETYRTKLS